jgi:flagellar basal body rod protein FlgG
LPLLAVAGKNCSATKAAFSVQPWLGSPDPLETPRGIGFAQDYLNMNASLFQSAAALQTNARWQEVISENLSASVIPGFKKQDLAFSAVQAGVMETSGALGSSQRLHLPSATTANNFSAGELRSSGNKTDFALEGSGFFEVQLPNGTTAFTRDGEFRLDGQGQLVTKEGYAVMGESGPIQFNPQSSAPIEVSSTGEISQGDENRGKLKIADFSNPELLTNAGAGYFVARDPGLVPQPSNATVRQSYLESGNTSAVTEMVNLISSLRMFEANQRALQKQDERMGRLINEVANPS